MVNGNDTPFRAASFAEIAVNSPFGGRETYCYEIPTGISVSPGQAVLVPFGDKVLQGIVIEITETPSAPLEKIRLLSLAFDTRPLLSRHHLALARWVSAYYLSPLFDAVSLMLPPGYERRSITFISLTDKVKAFDVSRLPANQQSVFAILSESVSETPLGEIEKRLGLKSAQSAVSSLVEKGLAVRRHAFEPVRVKPKMEAFLKLCVSVEDAKIGLTTLRKGTKAAALLEFLIESNDAVAWAAIREIVNCTTSVADALKEKGFIIIEHAAVNREPFSYANIAPSTPPVLTGAQKHALERIRASLDKTPAIDSRPEVFLLHGVTGSGKTEVYLQALAETVKRGKRGIILVPEIALTPQTVERFASRFPHRVAVLHSRLSLGEQYDEWRRIRDGEFDVVIGARSAIFAPQPDLGLIVIDEEHEWTYKQSDTSPRYHTRDVALKLAALTSSLVILGTATPDVSSFYRAQRGRYHLLSLPERVHGSPTPQMTTIDMRDELKAGNNSLISRTLKSAVDAAIGKGEQAILFLNRRGTASFVQCRACGYVLRCRRCNMPLTYHAAEEYLICHQCGYRMNVPSSCPGCGSPNISYLGAGTQKLEEEVKGVFPRARIIRWDSDSASGKNAHEKIAAKFKNREADILVGTQMVASGLDFPGVSVVGVVSADFALNLPDFRAGERTFQLIMQVAGRAGRGTPRASAIIQTFSPENYAIKAASVGDYRAFYEKEIAYRRELVNPPLSRLVALTFSHINEAACRTEAERLKKQIAEIRDSEGIAGLSIIGPAPAFIPRLRGRYRYQMVLRSVGKLDFLAKMRLPRGWVVDVDPVGMG